MTTLKTLGLIALAGCSAQLFAADFEFDRPGEGLSTGITPVGNVAWEQGLPTARYSKSGDQTETTLSADMLLRTGLSDDLELRLGWAGPTWTQVNPMARLKKMMVWAMLVLV